MKWVLIIGTLLMSLKFFAYYLTHSNAILTDAIESIVNVLAGMFALYSLYYAAKPKDEDHPYGHGKIELLSAGFEGGLIFISGVFLSRDLPSCAEASTARRLPFIWMSLAGPLSWMGLANACRWTRTIWWSEEPCCATRRGLCVWFATLGSRPSWR